MDTPAHPIQVDPAPYRRRPSARWLVLNPRKEVLLFRFEHHEGPLAGMVFWATPGGGLEAGETFEQAAVRELFEETGIAVADVGPPVAQREFQMTMPDGEQVLAEERFFAVSLAQDTPIHQALWTDIERKIMTAHRWWSPCCLEATADTIAPRNLADLLKKARLW